MSIAPAVLLFLFGTDQASAGIINPVALESRLYTTIGPYSQTQINNEPLGGDIIGSFNTGPLYVPSFQAPQFGMTIESTGVGFTKWEPHRANVGINFSGSLSVNGPGNSNLSEDLATFAVNAIASGTNVKLGDPEEKYFAGYSYRIIGSVDPGFKLRVVAGGAIANQLSTPFHFFSSNDDKTFTGSFDYTFQSSVLDITNRIPFGSTPLWLSDYIQVQIIRTDLSVTSGGGYFHVGSDPITFESVSPVPEPSSAVSASVIAVALCLYRRRSKS